MNARNPLARTLLPLLLVTGLGVSGCDITWGGLDSRDINSTDGDGVADLAAVIGFVQDARTLQPIPHATVRLGDQSVIASPSGWYSLADVAAGTYTLEVSSYGYDLSQRQVELTGGPNDLGSERLPPKSVVIEEDTDLNLIFVVDRSNSMQVTDPNGQVLTAVDEAASRAFTDGAAAGRTVSIAVIGFAGTATVATVDGNGTPGFSRDTTAVSEAVAGLAPTASNTGYADATTAAHDLLAAHLLSVPAAERADNRYEVVFISDGLPFPDNCDGEANAPAAAIDAFADMAQIGDDFGITVRAHTYFTQVPGVFDLPVSGACDVYTQSYAESVGDASRAVLQAMATAGGGLYAESPNADAFSLAPLKLGWAGDTLGNPVRVLFVVDRSGSLQFNETPLLSAVKLEMLDIRTEVQNVSFGIVLFNAMAEPVPALDACSQFLRNPLPLAQALTLAEPDSLTDVQGALNVARAMLDSDMQRLDAATDCPGERPALDGGELADARYRIVVVSDGAPDPVCTAGLGNDLDPVNPTEPYVLCEDDDFIACLTKRSGTTCDTGICTFGSATCFDPDDGWDGSGYAPSELLFGGVVGTELEGGAAYNQPFDLVAKTEALMRLADTYSLDDIQVHTHVLSSDGGGIFDPYDGEVFQQMAEAGQGTFALTDDGNAMSFDGIDFTAKP